MSVNLSEMVAKVDVRNIRVEYEMYGLHFSKADIQEAFNSYVLCVGVSVALDGVGEEEMDGKAVNVNLGEPIQKLLILRFLFEFKHAISPIIIILIYEV